MSSYSASATSTVASTSASSAITYTATSVPVAEDNPFLETTRFEQGALYVIIFPILLSFILLYIIVALVNKYKASKMAKNIAPFDRDYEFRDYHHTNADNKDSFQSSTDYDNYENPFSDKYETSNKSFTHNKNLSSVEFISQYRRSMDRLSGMDMKTNLNNINNQNTITSNNNDAITLTDKNINDYHSRNKNQSVGSVLQLNFSQQPQLDLQPQNLANVNTVNISSNSNNNSNSISNSDPETIYYSMVGTENSSMQGNPPLTVDHDDIVSFYSLAEPSKAMSNTTINIPNNKAHFHHRKLSSMALDEFINTGELPVLNQQPRTIDDINYENGNGIMQNPNNNASVESHSMFEDVSFNNSYNIPDSDSNVRHSIIRSPSPQRSNRMYHQNASRSPTRSPVRNNSPTRSPGKSPTRDTFPIV